MASKTSSKTSKEGSKQNYIHFVPAVKVVPEWHKHFKFVLIESLDHLREVLEPHRGTSPIMSFDTETSSLNPEEGHIVGYSFCLDGLSAYYVAVNHYETQYNLGEESLDIIYEFMCQCKRVCMFNTRFDSRYMEYYGFNHDWIKKRFIFIKYDMSKVPCFDVSLPCWLSDTNVKMPSLKESALRFLGIKMQTYAEVSDGVETFYYVNPVEATFYASSDALATFLLVPITMKYYNEASFAGRIDNESLYPLMHYESERIYLNQKLLNRLEVECVEALYSLEKSVYDSVGNVFNLNSPIQVSNAFLGLGIDTGGRTATGYMKTGIDELENLPEEVKNQHPALAKFIEYKSLFKFLSSYVKVLNVIARDCGFVRASYKNQAAPTGRLASGKDTKNTYFSAYNIQSTPKPHPAFFYVLDMGDRSLFNKQESIILGYKFVPVEYSKNEEGKKIQLNGAELYPNNYLFVVEGMSPELNVRNAFTSNFDESEPENTSLVCSIDFSGQELRLAANFSHEHVWLNAFKTGGDVHKSCYSLDTEILTPDGFKFHTDIGFDDPIAQYNEDTEMIEWVKAGHIYYNESDTMYHFQGRNTDLLVTPNHRMYSRGRDNWYIYRADKIYKKATFDTICSSGIDEDINTIKCIEVPPSTHSDGIYIDIKDFVELLGYVLTDGGTCKRSGGNKAVYFSQSEVKPEILEKMQNLNARLGGLFHESTEHCKGRLGEISGTSYECHGDFHRFHVCRAELYEFIVSNFGGPLKKDRFLPPWFRTLPKDLLSIFLKALEDGDGHKDSREGRTCVDISFQSKRLADGVQLLYMTLGYSTNINESINSNGVVSYRLSAVPDRKVVVVNNKHTKIITYPEKVKSFCFAVPSGLLVVRREGKISVCGNTAENVWGKENYDKEKRKMAKAVNFSVIYGAEAMSYVGLGKSAEKPSGMNLPEAEEFFEKYKAGLPSLFAYQDRLVKICRQKGTVSTFFGRPRRVKYYFENRMAGFGKRTILNSPIQGTAGDVLKRVMKKLWDKALNHPDYRDDVRFLSTVHDEINYSIKTYRLNEIAKLLEDTMYFPLPEWEVPLTVEVSFGWTWGSLFSFEWDEETLQYKPKKG